MKVVKTDFEGLLEIYPQVFEDDRGHFFESYNEVKLTDFAISKNFPLEFQSKSKRGVLRGLHFQKNPHAQGKLVRVAKGKVLDIVVDIRKNSKTYGKWKSFILDNKENKMLWIPVGFAHGFLTLEDDTLLMYKVTSNYSKEAEGGIVWDDKDLKIDWQLKENGIKDVILSERDKKHPTFKELSYSF